MNPPDRVRRARRSRLRRNDLVLQRQRIRTNRRRRRFVRIVLLALAVLSLLGMSGAGVVWAAYNTYTSQLPNPQALAADEPALDSHVYAADGSLIYVFHDPDARHEHVALQNISRWVVLATIDTEDRHFYDESSWDLLRLAKAGFSDITHSGQTQGASTITEQLAKISFLPSEQSIDRKIKQLILGNEIDASFSKDQILEMYLNRISYGNFSIGIETAADLYFHKHAKDLDLAEASLLAGLPQAPTAYNPVIHDASVDINPAAKARQRVVLDAMVNNGDITQAAADAAYNEKLVPHSWTDSEINPFPSFINYLQSYLNDKFGASYIKPGGWEIYTTLDVAKQHAAESALQSGITAIRSKNANDGAVVSLDPNTGGVLAMVGAANYQDPGTGQLNMAIRPRQPGSTIKLFTYSAAIASRKFTMTTPILDAPITFTPPSPGAPSYTPNNYDLLFHGVCQLKVCFGNSLNVPAVKTEVATGIEYITDVEIAAGLSSLTQCAMVSGVERCNRPGPYDYAATLGSLTFGVTPLDLADGAATIADMGVHHDPAPITKIIDALSSQTIWSYDPAAVARQVIPADVAFIISEITSNDANRQAEFGPHGDLTLGTRRVSAKTGTTDDFTDNWTVGWTPQITTAVWVGNPTPSCLRPQDAPILAAAIQKRGILYKGQAINDPYSPQDLAHYGITTPINDHCGHLVGSTGITGAAPIWHKFMTDALNGAPQVWYTKPADVIENGTGDNGDFYLPGTSAYMPSPFGVSRVPEAPAAPTTPAPTPTP